MIETNIRVVYPGKNFYMRVRNAEVRGSNLSIDLIERACGRLRYQYGLAAVPVSGNLHRLLVSTSRSIPSIHMEDEEWELEISDTGEKTQILTLADSNGNKYLSPLLERALMANLARNTQLWTLDSPRIWYEPEPFMVDAGIAVYRRYQITAIPLDDEGIGIAVDVGTAFFSTDSLAYFFDPDVLNEELLRRGKSFAQLTNRQAGQKGTLLYDNGIARVKCYFESAPQGITCSTTGKIRVKGQTYDSLYEYYKAEYPKLKITPSSPAVRVSFSNISRPQWVAAEHVIIRVMNDSVPRSLSSVDKIKPQERRDLIEEFWTDLGETPFGMGLPKPYSDFWRPRQDRVSQFEIPELSFGQNRVLTQPSNTAKAYRENYRQRLEYLDEFGCYYVPPDMPRIMYFAYPDTLDEKICKKLAQDLTLAIQSWIPYSMQAIQPRGYNSVSEAIDTLRNDQEGIVVFVLNDEPSAYHEVSFQLDRWRVKRITEYELSKHYKYLKNGMWNRKKKEPDLRRGQKRWQDFVTFNALEVLQLLDVVPYRFSQAGDYEAQLFIDVGHNRRHFALSLLITRDDRKKPDFCIVSDVQVKTDHQHDAINPKILSDEIIKLFEKVLHHRSDPIQTLLVLRDGKFCGDEPKGIDNAVTELISKGKLTNDSRVDCVDFRKDSLKSVRIWDADDDSNIVDNPLDGSAIRLNKSTVVVAATGASTLHQGTAQPFVIVGNGKCSDPVEAARAAFIGAQLNWSSPSVAQKLPLYAKRIDEDLKTRADQEIKRLS
jgi:hypothetical protein